MDTQNPQILINGKEPRKMTISTIADSVIVSTNLSSKKVSIFSTTSIATKEIDEFPYLVRKNLIW